ncbi:lysophospholipid acyltransferase family protein [Nitratifractor salsuginis]|uniref:1-acyl-sn-glycerol-3-phosphate acyltransferase n=1 Tax=Nitratifractor salsuginis (strain DSM 16511 / JCM 12458 / E9I37-1) TaxID=749222 RepID=E6X039_NITSE|nr:lysophospholipid acyltransferase family protein [Nitratifractor salsuginis]ADV46762.1 1-acyl-sn-glycerol-3-phosphate acyltransferase [Nitratifractor salsuginis DSM 16511]
MTTFAKIRFYWGAFVISTVVGLGMIPLIHLFPKYKGTIMHKLNRVILFLIGAKIEKVGERDPRANLFLMNHQGIIDIITMEAIENVHWCWVAKKELFEVPWFGKLLQKGDMVSVDRQNKAGLVKLFKDAQECIEQKHRAVAIFPEGTRASGQKLLPFKPGPKFIAQKLKLVVQPVVIIGSKWVLNEHNRTAHNGTVKVIYLPAVDVSKAPKDWYEQIRDEMQKVIDRESEGYSIER